jgi:hypothetical protein
LDDDESDELKGGRNKGKPYGRKRRKEKAKKQAEATSLREKIDDMMKSKPVLVNKTLEARMIMAEKKHQEKHTRWQELQFFEDWRVQIEEKKAMAELITNKNKTMMADPSVMYLVTRE